jgi:spindle assembly abnormal protein 6
LLLKELKSKNSLLEQQQEVLHLTTERKNELEAKIVNMEESVGTKRASLQQLQSEVVKANEIIAKQLNEIQNLSGKVKLRTEVALKQESLLDAREKELAELKSKMAEARGKAIQWEDDVSEIKDELNKAQESMQAKDLIIKNNEQGI